MSRIISEPVKATCPKIDEALSRISNLESFANDILYECRCVRDELEDLRSANDALRSWGYDSNEIIVELEEEIDNLQFKIDNNDK